MSTHTVVSPRLEEEQRQHRTIHQAVRRLIREHKQKSPADRRANDRVDFIHPIKVRLEDGREFGLLSRDLSTTGIRLIGTRSLLGHKVTVFVPRADDLEPVRFSVRILWTCTVGDGLFENGGTFLELVSGQ
jgi:hypothetical protein